MQFKILALIAVLLVGSSYAAITCTPTITSCLGCQEADTSKCLTCEKGHYKSDDEKACPSCELNCVECSKDACTSCRSGYQPDGKMCKAEGASSGETSGETTCTVSYCKTCNPKETCTTCMDGYMLMENQCKKCIDGCMTCENTTSCKKCMDKYELKDNKCVKMEESKNSFSLSVFIAVAGLFTLLF